MEQDFLELLRHSISSSNLISKEFWLAKNNGQQGETGEAIATALSSSRREGQLRRQLASVALCQVFHLVLTFFPGKNPVHREGLIRFIGMPGRRRRARKSAVHRRKFNDDRRNLETGNRVEREAILSNCIGCALT